MHSVNKNARLAIFAAGLLCLVLFALLPLIFPDPEFVESNYLKQLRIAAGVFYGATGTDLGQDIVGMRALWSGSDPYPILGPAVEQLGLHWDLDFHSPHPPTAFLLTAPVAFFQWATASLLWALLMIACWMVALYLLGLPWDLSIGLGGLMILWTPAAFSLGQMTPIWLLFLSAAYAWRAGRPNAAGAAIALAAMTKYTPAVALINFVKSPNRLRVAAAFALSWFMVLVAIWLLNAGALPRFLEINQANSLDLIQGPENAAPLGIFWRTTGWLGVIGWLTFLGIICAINWQSIYDNTTRGWMVTFYLAVAILPVLWIYSLLPLLPVAGYLLIEQNRLSKALILVALILTFLSPAFGVNAVPYVSGAVLVFGLALFPGKLKSLNL